MLDLLGRDPSLYVVVLFVVVASVVLHELGHGLAATHQGDPTPRMLGHLTWNPRVHMGWLGLALAAFMGFAFGRTPVNRRNFRDRRWGSMKVSFAGPAVNLALWIVSVVVLGMMLGLTPDVGRSGVGATFMHVLSLAANLNLLLFVFNMIPVPPLDGFDVFGGFIDMGEIGVRLRAAGSMPLIVVILVVWHFGVLDWVFSVSDGAVAAVTRVVS